jgi:drug/metabolite transporter (DMT)-like permease
MAHLVPLVFVVLWSTGFIGSKAGLPYIEPLTFLVVRFAIVTPLFVVWSLASWAPWPRGRQALHVAVVGALLHGVYLGGVFVSISWGLPAGVSALIVGLQPLLTAGFIRMLGERVSARQWLGLGLGFVGVGAVLWEKLGFDGIPLAAIWPSVAGLFGITFGTLYQQRFCGKVHLATGGVVQYAAATLVLIPAMLAFETRVIDWTPQLVGALAWLILVLSMGAISLLMLLARRGAAAQTASLFYLVPPTTALMAWGLFGEVLGFLALAGMALTAFGVYLVRKS